MEWIDKISTVAPMDFDVITDENYVRYAMRHYDNPQCTGTDEFQEDLDRVRYLKRLFTMYTNDGDLRERLILNHLIVFYNVFGVVPAARMLFLKIPQKFHYILKTFMLFLNVFPVNQADIPEVVLDAIPLDINIYKQLKDI